jgi:hypothetical protein
MSMSDAEWGYEQYLQDETDRLFDIAEQVFFFPTCRPRFCSCYPGSGWDYTTTQY